MIKPGLIIEIHEYSGPPYKGVIISINKKDEYEDGVVVSAYCTIKFDGGYIYSDMYITQNDIVESTEKEKMRGLERCEDKGCVYYDTNKVDLGWGYPVCRSLHAKPYPIPLDPKFRGYKKYYRVVHCEVME